jgi:cell division protein FtsB
MQWRSSDLQSKKEEGLMKKIIFIWVLSLVLLSSVSVSAQTVSKDTSQVAQDILKLKAQNDTLKMEFEKVKKDNYEKAM